MLAQGLAPGGFRSFVDFDEYIVVFERLWQSRRIVVRIYDRAVSQSDVDDLRSLLDSEEASDGLILAPKGLNQGTAGYPNVSVLGPSELAAQIERSPLAEWTDDRPSLAASRLDVALTLPEAARLVDPAGIAWLPALALNELPTGLQDLDLEPQDVLEQKAFRILTSLLRFGGVRYGESRRGERLPDALLTWASEPNAAAMLDCKAASSGYHMAADHVLRFEKYYDLLSPEIVERGATITHLVVVSSHFPGPDDYRHAFYGRREELYERTGMQLAYLRAADLAWFSYDLEAREVPLDSRAAVRWSVVFDKGLIQPEDLYQSIQEVG
jgi:hypothetical protein